MALNNGRKLNIGKIIIGIVIIVPFLITVFLNIDNFQGLTCEVDRNVININRDILSINDALPEVNNRATKWHKDATLYNVLAQFNGMEEINSRKGIIYYHYNVKNLDYGFFKVGGAQSVIKVDMNKKCVYEFESLGTGKDLNFGDKLNIETIINFDEAFNYFIKKHTNTIFRKYKKPIVNISYANDKWNFKLFESSKYHENYVEIAFNVQSGKIIEERP